MVSPEIGFLVLGSRTLNGSCLSAAFLLTLTASGLRVTLTAAFLMSTLAGLVLSSVLPGLSLVSPGLGLLLPGWPRACTARTPASSRPAPNSRVTFPKRNVVWFIVRPSPKGPVPRQGRHARKVSGAIAVGPAPAGPDGWRMRVAFPMDLIARDRPQSTKTSQG